MEFTTGGIYHIYNRGNNRQQVFFEEDHYLHFELLMRRCILPCADLLAWCFMPNHFHLLIHANEESVRLIRDGSFDRHFLCEGVKTWLSAYTRKINREMGFTGSRFQQKTKAKEVGRSPAYAQTAFQYIHQNPLRAGLVKRMEDWKYSSFRDYAGFERGSLCRKPMAVSLLGLNMKNFYQEAYQEIDEDLKVQIFKP